VSPVDTQQTNATENVPGAVLTLGAFLLIIGGVLCALWMFHPLERPGIRTWDLEDLAVYRAAGRAVLHGHSVFGPYVADQLRVPLPFIYPPFAAIIVAPFSFLGETPANVAWTAFTIVLLGGVVRICFAPLIQRFGRAAPVALIVTLVAVAALSPVEEHLRFGQVGIPLMACCVFDCLVERPRWPRGALIGIAAAVKLIPAIFVPYLWLTGRKRAAIVATATFGAMTLIGVVVTPGDSWDFFHSKIFEPTSPKYFSNQSLEGILQRAIGGPWRVVWLLAVIAVVVYGFRTAIKASRFGDELRAVAIIGLVSVLASPISWIHHLVWVIPVLAAIVGAGRDRRQFAVAFVVAALFVARLPYWGHDELRTGFIAAVMQDSYGFLCIALLVYLGRGVRERVPVSA
jgi:alpha-1,2-mannosyltransferase